MSSHLSEGWLISSPLLEDTYFYTYRKTVEIRLQQIATETIKAQGFKLLLEESSDNVIIIKVMKHGYVSEIVANKINFQFVDPPRIVNK